MGTTTIKKNNPVVTVIIESISKEGDVGPHLTITGQVESIGPSVNFTEKRKEVYLLQKTYDIDKGPLKLSLNLKEDDPVYVDEKNKNHSLGIDFEKPTYKKGNETVEVKIKAYEGNVYGTRKATYSFKVKWFVTSNACDIAEYIQTEMTTNLNTASFKSIKKKIDDLLPITESLQKKEMIDIFSALDFWKLLYSVLDNFRMLVGDNQIWDHKKDIKPEFGEWSFDTKTDTLYRFDIWSNVHYGYIGSAIGFSKRALLYGAALNQAKKKNVSGEDLLEHIKEGTLHTLDEKEDQEAIKIGIYLWENKGQNVTKGDIIKAIRRRKKSLFTKPSREGKAPPSIHEVSDCN